MAFNITTISSLVPEKYYFGQPPEAVASTVLAIIALVFLYFSFSLEFGVPDNETKREKEKKKEEVTAAEILPSGLSIGVKNGKISCIAQWLPASSSTRVIDAEGAYVTPYSSPMTYQLIKRDKQGGVDSHVHLDQDNAPTGDKWLTGSRSALAGGTTTILAFATQKKADKSLYPVVEDYHDRSKGQSYVDYGFHLILSNPTKAILEEELPVLSREGITSAKLYMTYERLKLSDGDLLEVLLRARQLGMTTMIHAENCDMIDVISKRLVDHGYTLPQYHANARPQIAESEATYRAISLSTLTSTPILIVHISSPVALQHAQQAQKDLLPIHAETCPHYLYLLSDQLHASDTDDDWEGAKHVCAPPLRHSRTDLEALWQSINNGTINVISSDHAPSKYNHPQGKRKPFTISDTPTFTQIPNGLPGIETRLPLLFHAATSSTSRITLPKFVELTSSNAAKIYGLTGVKGSIAPGYDADLTIWYPVDDERGKVTITNEMLHHSIDYTPFEGFKVDNWPRWTIFRGEVAWDRDNGGVLGHPGRGTFLKRSKGEVIVGKKGQGVPGMTTTERNWWMGDQV